MQRFALVDIHPNDESLGFYSDMRARPYGEWVRYEEAQEEVLELRQRLHELSQRIKELEESQEHLHE